MLGNIGMGKTPGKICGMGIAIPGLIIGIIEGIGADGKTGRRFGMSSENTKSTCFKVISRSTNSVPVQGVRQRAA